ncbi:PA domain-containing protein isoform 2 [Cladophialophora immunda]|nr:PA domain-containing protein isoform 2 [Cladophialophora immunda]
MEGFSSFFGQPYPGSDPQETLDGYTQDERMSGIDPTGMEASAMGQAQTLQQIIIQNNDELMRRRNTFQSQYREGSHDHGRRASMLEFSSAIDSDLANFQFDPNPNEPSLAMGPSNIMSIPKSLDPRRVRSREDLSLNTRFSQMNASFENMQPVNNFSPGVVPSTSVPVEPSTAYLPPSMDMAMDFETLAASASAPNMQSGPMQEAIFSASPIEQAFSIPYQPVNHDPGGGSMSPPGPNPMAAMAQGMSSIHEPFPGPSQQLRRQTPVAPLAPGSLSTMTSPIHIQDSPNRRRSVDFHSAFSVKDVNATLRAMNPPSLPHMPPVQGGPMQHPKYANAYSSSGFDMLGVLMRVATRPRPEINIGPVDLSCAFVVCDIEKFDLPIVYCSEMFERLTGYTRHEVLGRNCRFLQAPDGRVQSGMKRKYVDDNSVLYLKNQITKRQEAQLSLINYRKGGQPFMNLLTMIPIQFDSEDYKFYVGFQVDLVEQPSSVSGKNPDGTYEINYNRSSLPAYHLPTPPDPTQALQDIGQTVSPDEVSRLLTTLERGDFEVSKRVWDKVLLENNDDVVHVLSLKGLFLYVSPASRRVLEYDPSELVGVGLSSICHPSDIVPVTRELKDTPAGEPVSVVYRIRRKFSGYTWFEAHGTLYIEQGKGRKFIILAGRERPVYALDRTELATDGNFGESELWSKISTSGMFLHVSSASRAMLDRLPEDLVGTSLQALMRPDSKREFRRLLEVARTGEKVTFRHDLQNRRGQVLHAQTTIHPGDARLGSKPTFLLAQTRLLKMTRAALLNQQKTASATSSARTDRASAGSGTTTSRPPGRLSSNAPDGSTRNLTEHPGSLQPGGNLALSLGNQDEALASEDNIFDELKTTRSSSWQFELRQMERQNRLLNEELQALISRKKKRKRRKGLGQVEKDCANCHTRNTPEWRRGPSGNRDLCNSCGLRWAKQNGRVTPRKPSNQSDKSSKSPAQIRAANKTETKNGEMSETINSGSAQLVGTVSGTISQKENTDDWRGQMPSKIEEGEEPPYPSILPT